MTKDNNQYRIECVDALRALAILLVIYGHSVQYFKEFFIFTSPIKIPLFFAITGYVFKTRGGDQIVFFNNLFKKIVIPYVFLALISIIFVSSLNGFNGLMNSLIGIVSGDSFWFMPCIIVAEVIHFYIHKFGRDIYGISFLCISSFILGTVFSNYTVFSFAMISNAFIVQLYLFLGYLYSFIENRFDKKLFMISFLSLFLYILFCFISLHIYPSKCLDVHLNYYYNLPFCILLILLGNFSLFGIFKIIGHFPRWILYIGQNTMILYLWSGIAMIFFIQATKILNVVVLDKPLWAILELIWVVAFCCLCSYLVTRIAPELLGKKRK